MRATDMWNLISDARGALRMVDYWHHGEGQFKDIEYCDFCSYSKSHGHGEQCIVTPTECRVGRCDLYIHGEACRHLNSRVKRLKRYSTR
jgi:hypothetical protein